MKCGKCGDLLSSKASTLQQTLPDRVYQFTVLGHGMVTICSKCYDDYRAILREHRKERGGKIRAWFEGSS